METSMAQLADFHHDPPGTQTRTNHPGAIRTLGLWAARLIDTLLDWQERAHQRHHLSGLDDRLIRDMGLSRAEIDAEVHKPFWKS
jgi:uncharacterized protein YjiS (DUF1127 family)